MNKSRGVTLPELMVATVILTVGVLGLVGAILGVQKALLASKLKSLANNLAQEQMQILKQKNYNSVLLTAAPASYSGANGASIPYDPTYFPPQTVTEGGHSFTRLTYVQPADEDSGAVVILPPGTPDAGMRLITVTVVWNEKEVIKQVQLRSIFSNPDTVMNDSIVLGRVRDSVTLSPLNNALVNAAQDLGYRDTTNSVGSYSISLSPGGYNMVAISRGYFTGIKPVTAAANQSAYLSFDLQPMSSGSVTGTAWMNTNLLISQVAVSSVMANADNMDIEYIELFNPTTHQINIANLAHPPGTVPAASRYVALSIASTDGTSRECDNVELVYNSTYVAAGWYYLIANTNTFVNHGTLFKADAYYSANAGAAATCIPTPPPASDWFPAHAPQPMQRIMQASPFNGVVWLTDASGNTLDTVGWSDNAGGSPHGGSNYLPTPAGILGGDQIVRSYSPSQFGDVYGRAYNSGVNSLDFYYNSTASPVGQPYHLFNTTGTITPYTVSGQSVTIISGTPPVGAVVSCTDGLSVSTVSFTVGSPPQVNFTLTQVATGTWSVFIDSGNYELENDTVTIAASGSTYNFPSSTTFLSQYTTTGFVSGRVTNILGAAIPNPGITVDPGAAGTAVTADFNTGRYLLRVTPGMVDITANPASQNSSYVTLSSVSIPIALGTVHSDVDFMLSQGGRITGFVTRDGQNALPNVAVGIMDSNGQTHDQEISNSNGRFTTPVLSTGVYTLQPALDSLTSALPVSVDVTVLSGQVVWSTTFTITGALAYIKGKVTYNGVAVKTGALLVATTTTLPSGPPALSSNSLTSAPFYMTSSQEDGTYSLGVRQSSYRVFCYYFNQDPTTGVVSILTQILGTDTTAGLTINNLNCAMPP